MSKRPSIYYVYDPLCAWCFAFSDVILKIYDKYQEWFDFVPISGGMITGANIGPIREKKELLISEMQRVSEVTGVTFGEGYINLLEDGSYVCNSVKPSVGLTVIKSLKPEKGIEFLHTVQLMYFLDGKDLNDQDLYISLALKFGIDPEEFLNRLKNPLFHDATSKEFELVKKMGISGFPTMLCQTEKGLYLLNRGYSHFEDVEKLFDSLKNAAQNDGNFGNLT